MAVFSSGDKNVVNLSNSFLQYYGAKTHHDTLAELDTILQKNKKQNVVFLILDGLSDDILCRHLKRDGFIRKHQRMVISSVFPPTTAAATTSMHSGLYPIEHGWLGWMPYFREFGEAVEIFLNRGFYTHKPFGSPSAAEKLPYKTIYQQILEQNHEVEYKQVFPKFVSGGAKTFKEMCCRIAAIDKEAKKPTFVSAYWTSPDHELHEDGVDSAKVSEVIQDIENNLQKLSQCLQNSIVIITADHGIVNTEPVCLNDYPKLTDCFAVAPSLEGRAMSFFIKDGKQEYFASKFNEIFGDDFILFTHEDFLNSKLLGYGTEHPRVKDFIGDYVAVGTGDKCFCYKQDGGLDVEYLAANHAGLTPAEMNVPLIVF